MNANILKNLTLSELKNVHDILTSLTREETIKIKLLNVNDTAYNYKLRSLCLVLAPAEYNKNNKSKNLPYREFIGKVCYIVNEIAKNITRGNLDLLINTIFTDNINIIVKCDYSNKDITICKYEDKMFIELSYSYLNELFIKNPNILSNCQQTLFIFEEITWECLQIIFNCLRIRISGGSHSKRHLISPLDLRLIDCLALLRKFSSEIIIHKSNLDIETIENFHRNDYRKLLESIINYSYYKKHSLKSMEVKSALNKFFFINKLFGVNPVSRKDFPEILFLFQYNILVDFPNLFLIRRESYKKVYENYLSEVHQRISELTNEDNSIQESQSVSNDLKINQDFCNSTTISSSSNNKSSISSLTGGSKRGIHTLRRLYSSNTEISKGLVKVSPEKGNYLLKAKDIINNEENKFIAQEKLEISWQEIYQDFIKEDRNIINKYTQNTGLLQKGINLLLLLFNKKRSYLIKRCGLIIEDSDFNFLNALIVAFVIGRDCAIKGLGYTYSAMKVGSNIISEIYIKKRQDYRKSCIKEDIYVNYPTELKDLESFYNHFNLTEERILYLGDFFLSRLIEEPIAVFERSFNRVLGYLKNETAILNFNPDKIEEIKNFPLLQPISLPMLCPPNKWSETEYGGYLINKDLQEDLIIGRKDHKHTTTNRDILYNTVNIMSAIKFEVNKDLLYYLKTDGKYLLDSLELDEVQKSLTLFIADLYKDTIFYIPLRADWRGRIYSNSSFLNYQGNELSSSLILLHESEALTELGRETLYIYIANIYNEKGINKSNYLERIKWTENNKEKILSMNPNFILAAEDKFKFTALCLLMRELDKDPQYKVKLPVFFDATCSGIQHLAGLMRDSNLAKEVNLTSQTTLDDVFDIYSKLAIPINEKIRRIGREDPKYTNLIEVNLSRKIVKKPIMTKTYNVTVEGIVDQLLENITTNKKGEIKSYAVPSILEGKICYLNKEDIRKIANIINDTFFEEYPLIQFFYEYLKDLAKIMNLANLGISWITPNGLTLLQYYKHYNSNSVLIPLFKKKAVLKTKSGKLDSLKQVNAIIPNVIHSLDANHLMKVVKKVYFKLNKPVITIHDCFGTHPNNMATLIEIVKCEFVELYSNQNFILEFHKFNLKQLEINGFEIKTDDKTFYSLVNINNSWELIPNPPLLGDLDLKEVKNSVYMLN